MKKIGSLALLFLAVLTLVPATVILAAFSDVTSTSTIHYGAIEYLHSKEVISGYPDGTFKPDQTINRAEALKMVMLATGKAGVSTQNISFPDVGPGDWFYEYVRKAVETGLVEGYKDGSFKPANNINVAESLKIILLAFDMEVGNPPTQNPYPDVDVLAWYVAYADFAKNKYFIEAADDGLLHAERDITRGQFAEMIFRLMYTKENNLDKFPLSTNWPTYNDSSNGFSIKYPPDWRVIKAGNQVILWKRDDINEQLSWARVLPLSATVVIAIDANETGYSVKEYTDLLDYDSGAVRKAQTLNEYPFASISLTESGLNDYFFELPGKKIMAVYSQVGTGENQPLLLEKIRYMIGSVKQYTGGETGTPSPDLDKDSFLSEVRKLILVKDKGQTVLNMFNDELLVETDTIGIGTGPVDYYYSVEYDVTLKLERGSNTVLALNDGKTTAF